MMLSRASRSLHDFIAQEKKIFQSLPIPTPWELPQWDVQGWLPQRNKRLALTFDTHRHALEKTGYLAPPSAPLPPDYQNFSKALVIYLQRTRNLKFSMVAAYNISIRRLYNPLFERGISDPTQLTRDDFERVVRFLRESNYKNIYDAMSHLKVIADTMDELQISEVAIHFQHNAKPARSQHHYISLHDPERAEKQRKYDEKLPSREAMEAYAICTNNPISDGEEILLRTIDLLIATGQRGNEVAVIPYDCWVERPLKGSTGELVYDANGKPIVECGIRYFAEKQFQSRVHWFANVDIPFARRAIDRLKDLTQEQRKIATWQEDNPGRIWSYPPNEVISEEKVLEWLSFSKTKSAHRNLYLFLTRNGINPFDPETSVRGRPIKRRYMAGDIERLLLPKLGGHIALAENVKGKLRVVLKTSETLAIAFDGQFRFGGREANVFRAIPRRVSLVDINRALGADDQRYPSIFSRRSLCEADGTTVRLTSHQPRHWRNTIYHLMGMSDVQQALALGRQRLDQNKYYQHTTLEEDAAAHHDFLAFNSYHERIDFLHDSIRNGKIQGTLTDSYQSLLLNKGQATAERFLTVHASALHITPFGACTHDFSQAPCPKHLQCWNNCSHLHLQGTESEKKNIQKQIQHFESAILIMRENGVGEAGSDVWLDDAEHKLKNMQEALARCDGEQILRVFPDGQPVTVSSTKRRRSSVSDD